jgi:hypothetical protein
MFRPLGHLQVAVVSLKELINTVVLRQRLHASFIPVLDHAMGMSPPKTSLESLLFVNQYIIKFDNKYHICHYYFMSFEDLNVCKI